MEYRTVFGAFMVLSTLAAASVLIVVLRRADHTTPISPTLLLAIALIFAPPIGLLVMLVRTLWRARGRLALISSRWRESAITSRSSDDPDGR